MKLLTVLAFALVVLAACFHHPSDSSSSSSSKKAPPPNSSSCPKSCACFGHKVQCMHQSLKRIPAVPNDTVILDLRFNMIDTLDGDAFARMPRLQTLLLNHNRLTRLNDGAFVGLRQLRTLALNNNRIRHVGDAAFRGLDKLEKLYLHLNQITSIRNEVFSKLTSLERVFLHANRIERIPRGAFDELPNLKRLRLDSNPLICDCSILWLLNAAMENSKLQITAVCQNPPKMKGVSSNSLEMDHLECDKPEIVRSPDDEKLPYGGSAVLPCVARGDPAPQVVWMKNSQVVSNYPRYKVLNNGSLMIENIEEGDSGYYQCMAKSPLGVAKSRKARMILKHERGFAQAPPRILQGPEHKKHYSFDDSAFFDCRVTGYPFPHIIWFHNGSRILLNDRTKLHSNGTLQINRLVHDDAGSYKCQAENSVATVAATAELRIIDPFVVSVSYNPPEVKDSDDVVFTCNVQGASHPVFTWYKDDQVMYESTGIYVERNVLTIVDLSPDDSGKYTCRAQDGGRMRQASIQMTVAEQTIDVPKIVYGPYDIVALVGSKIELPCLTESATPVTFLWRKDGSTVVRTSRHKISAGGNLYVANVTADDGGRYECTATNQEGSDSAFGLVTVQDAPGNQFVRLAFAQAVSEVDRAINKTVESLFEKGDTRPDMSELYRMIRFPSAPERELARAAEVYERTLINVRHHINQGKKVNVTADFDYKELLTPDHLNLIAELSGCMAHRLTVDCSDMCFHSKYRSADGTCNNYRNPTWGASNTGFRRILKPIYENGFSQPVGWTKGLKYDGHELPNARAVSSVLISTDTVSYDDKITHMVMQWGQFLDHDLDHATPSVTSQSWDGIDCKRSCEYAAPCFPIDIPKDDPRIANRRCIDFVRSSPVCGSGATSIFFAQVQPREQINQLTSFLDASQVYGYSEEIANDLRNFTADSGELREGVTYPGRKPLLPFSSAAQKMDCRGGALESDIKCFVAGDIRANEQVGLLAMHTIWFREHNRLARELKRINPHWNGDKVYHEARKIVGAQMQHITYAHWLPIVVGKSGMEMLGPYGGYDPDVNPTIANVFATAALRFGHSLISPILHRLDENFEPIAEGHLELHKAFFASWRVADEGGVDPLLRGLFSSPAKLKTPRQNLNSELTEKLFHVAHAVALDLAAINIQRSRDHALPPYVEWRAHCNMSAPRSFDELAAEIGNAEVRAELRRLYGSVRNVDAWVGGILEDQVEGAKVGPLFRCLLVDQFRRLRDGDRHWYESADAFRPRQLDEIRRTTLAAVLCDNGDAIADVGADVFTLLERQPGGAIDCDDVPRMNLRHWTDCAECGAGRCPSLAGRSQRSVRSVEADRAFERGSELGEMRRVVDELTAKVDRLEEQCGRD